ncbi:GTPase family protein [Stenomitos frigidus]|uniref:GTPase n=1 Tax=Stenomitos frigidus ULC18 TaxID=2107698 RepID=A0A2T1ED33_9CYAN|nr:GTPase family protein [Stenomitos frigidus]PSB30659.1 GTPase [Stenomitos frigidus ULC18]
MVRLKLWQWVALGLPIASIISFLVIAAGFQIQQWDISWIWGVVVIMFVIWRWLLVKWTQPALAQVRAVVAEVTEELEAADSTAVTAAPIGSSLQQAETAIQTILEEARTDPPLWDGWAEFWARCKQVVEAVAHAYYPQVQRPLLQIYVPQAYALMRGTVEDMDQWMQKLSPALNQVTIGQAYQAYEIYQKLEPSARKILQAWNWAQWLLNPVAALARTATQRSSNRATQELLVNLGQLLREAALTNLGKQAIALYGGMSPAALELSSTKAALPKAKTQTLREILSQVEPAEVLEQKPINILLVGRTGAGKSSLINTLFVDRRAEVDVLPSTDRVQDYHWQAAGGETLTLWDTPGYEQANRTDLREQVLAYITQADLLLLVTPALDPALQMDLDFLTEARSDVSDLPAIAVVTQVDRLRPIREWAPPYDWEWGERPKEVAIREATEYRAGLLGDFCNLVVPIVTGDLQTGRAAWGAEQLSVGLIQTISPAKQLRLARFLRNLDARTIAAAKIIDHYMFQMTTTQGLTALLKSPVLRFISTLTTGSPTLAYLLAEQIPVEQLPVVLGKLQMAYDLFTLLNDALPNTRNFDLLALWSLLMNNATTPDRNAWAFGHAVTEYWTRSLTTDQLEAQFEHYLQQYAVK